LVPSTVKLLYYQQTKKAQETHSPCLGLARTVYIIYTPYTVYDQKFGGLPAKSIVGTCIYIYVCVYIWFWPTLNMLTCNTGVYPGPITSGHHHFIHCIHCIHCIHLLQMYGINSPLLAGTTGWGAGEEARPSKCLLTYPALSLSCSSLLHTLVLKDGSGRSSPLEVPISSSRARSFWSKSSRSAVNAIHVKPSGIRVLWVVVYEDVSHKRVGRM